jgi:hypothetical protein
VGSGGRVSTMKARLLLAVVIAMRMLVTSGAHAQALTGALVLQDPINARATAMGFTGAADNSDPANVWFNPANAVGATGAYATYSFWRVDIFEDVQFDRWVAGGSFPIADGVDLGVSATFGELAYGTSIVTDTQGNILAEFEAWERYLSIALAAGARVSDRVDVRAGVAGKRYWTDFGAEWFTQTSGFENPEGFAFDVGATVAVPTSCSGWMVTPALALAYVNFGGEIDEGGDRSDPFPSRIHAGASVRVDGPDIALGSAHVPLLSFVNNVDLTDRLHGEPYSWGMGVELAVLQILFLRSGMQDEQDQGYEVDPAAWSVGIGLPVGPLRARFDYARVRSLEEPRYDFVAAWEF